MAKFRTKFNHYGAAQAREIIDAHLAFLKDFRKETDRGAVLAAAAVLDDLLERTLLAFFVQNDSAKALVVGFNAPLGTFASRTAAAHAMGILKDSEKNECDLIRKVRNEFAHKLKASFKDDKIKSYCMALRYTVLDDPDPRSRFMQSAESVLLWMSQRPYTTKNLRLTPVIWDDPDEIAPGVLRANQKS